PQPYALPTAPHPATLILTPCAGEARYQIQRYGRLPNSLGSSGLRHTPPSVTQPIIPHSYPAHSSRLVTRNS
ncbi:MAG TPA: hypothetical protein VK963_04540, partial [Candidatus Saccharimonadales bacterium]|nr:hypothetical protein [Candidatus Saccharimonadales bacterium]